jgi:hypothetical protein
MPVLPVDLLSLLRGVRFNAGLNCNGWPEGSRSLYALSPLQSVGTVGPVPVRVGRMLQQTDGALEGIEEPPIKDLPSRSVTATLSVSVYGLPCLSTAQNQLKGTTLLTEYTSN